MYAETVIYISKTADSKVQHQLQAEKHTYLEVLLKKSRGDTRVGGKGRSHQVMGEEKDFMTFRQTRGKL